MNTTVDNDISGDVCSRSLFNLVNQAKSTQTTYMFIGLLTFSVVVETLIEYVEEKAQGTVIPQVLQKVYKELMLLGFVNFAIFILLSGDNISASTRTVASFEYADCVMFFVAVGIIGQTMWSIVCNQRFQKKIWKACGIDTMKTMEGHLRIMATPLKWESLLTKELGLKLRAWKASRSFEYDALNLQTFRMIFLTSHNLPDSFPFPHYLSTYLNAITVSFINIQPQSYFVLLVIILLSEFIVRNRPSELWGTNTTALETSTTFILFGVFGLLLAIIDFAWLFTLQKACYKLVFIQLNVGTIEEALVKNFVWASHSKDRTQKSLNTLNEDLKAYLDPRGWRQSKISSTFDKLVNSTDQTSDSTDRQTLFNQEVSGEMSSNASDTGAGVTASGSTSFKPLYVAAPSIENDQSHDIVKKTHSGVASMIKQAKSTVAASNRRFSELSRVLQEDSSWVSQDAQRAAQSATSLLPFSSLGFVRAAVDALRLSKIFYLSIFVTSFMVQSIKMSLPYALSAWMGFMIVLGSNVLTDPSITYHYVLLVTMASVNPLMLADTVDYMNDVRSVKFQVASKMIDLFRRGKRRFSKMNPDVPFTNDFTLSDMKLFILKTFKIWSDDDIRQKRRVKEEKDGGGDGDGLYDDGDFDDKVQNAIHLEESQEQKLSFRGVIQADKGVNRASLGKKFSAARIHLSKRRIDILFKLADPELTGLIHAEPFYSVISSAIQDIIALETSQRSATPDSIDSRHYFDYEDFEYDDFEYNAESEIDRLKRLSGAWYDNEDEGKNVVDDNDPSWTKGSNDEGGLKVVESSANYQNAQTSTMLSAGLLPEEDELLKALKNKSDALDVWGGEGKPVDSMAGLLDAHMKQSFMEKTDTTISTASASSNSSISTAGFSSPSSNHIAVTLAPHSQAIPSPESGLSFNDIPCGKFDSKLMQRKTISSESSFNSISSETSSNNSKLTSADGITRGATNGTRKKKSASLWEKTISMEHGEVQDRYGDTMRPFHESPTRPPPLSSSLRASNAAAGTDQEVKDGLTKVKRVIKTKKSVTYG